MVTMWILIPDRHQIVRFAFDNADWGFLPGRAIVRVDQAKATMAMGRYFDNVWLPKEIAFNFGATFAAGSYTFRYTRGLLRLSQGRSQRERSAATCRRSRWTPRPILRLLAAALLLVAGCAHALAQAAGPEMVAEAASTATTARPTPRC